MRITWSLPIRDHGRDSIRADVVRARSLIHALRADGHDVRVVEAPSPGNSSAASSYRKVILRLLPRIVALVLRDAVRAVRGWAHGRRVTAVAREQRAELIVETRVPLSGSGARAARAVGVPLVLDDCIPPDGSRESEAGLHGLARFISYREATAAACVVVPSEELAALLVRDRFPVNRIRVVPNGIDPKAHAHARACREGTRSRMGIREACTIAFVGSFQPWHDTELLVRAIASVKGGAALRVLFVGDGPGLMPTLRSAEMLGVRHKITSVGKVEAARVPGILGACDLGVLPGANSYGQPTKLLDYAAAGLPSVAPDLPPVRAWVKPGRNGFLFPPGDAVALARAIERLLHDPGLRRALGEVARRQVLATDNWTCRARALVAASPPAGLPREMPESVAPRRGRVPRRASIVGP